MIDRGREISLSVKLFMYGLHKHSEALVVRLCSRT